jgi:hypothetical protein
MKKEEVTYRNWFLSMFKSSMMITSRGPVDIHYVSINSTHDREKVLYKTVGKQG